MPTMSETKYIISEFNDAYGPLRPLTVGEEIQ